MLAYPEIMTDVVNTYFARYQRDGYIAANACLFTGPAGSRKHIRYTPVLFAEAYESGVRPVDYSKAYDALKDNYGNDLYVPASLSRMGYLTQPAGGGFACSQTLEFAMSSRSMGLLPGPIMTRRNFQSTCA